MQPKEINFDKHDTSVFDHDKKFRRSSCHHKINSGHVCAEGLTPNIRELIDNATERRHLFVDDVRSVCGVCASDG